MAPRRFYGWLIPPARLPLSESYHERQSRVGPHFSYPRELCSLVVTQANVRVRGEAEMRYTLYGCTTNYGVQRKEQTGRY